MHATAAVLHRGCLARRALAAHYATVGFGINPLPSRARVSVANCPRRFLTCARVPFRQVPAFDFELSVGTVFGVRACGGVSFTVAINPTNGAVTQFCNL